MLLEVDAVTKRFGGLTAVSAVSFGVAEGAVVGLIGPNGAGKTTLFNLIAGALPPSSGRIRFAGADITGEKPHRVCRRGLARTFQIVRPFGNLSVLDNVIVGAFTRTHDRRTAYDEAERLLETTGLGRWRDAAARSLPIGLRKRLEVARALATRPQLLLLDEVMNGLNPTELTEMMALIRSLNGAGTTILLIEHVMAAVMNLCSRIVVIHHGEKVAEAAPREIAHDPRVIEAYLGEAYLIE
ncbi:MAG: ABC transporter ATP-binding protein [Burkholderiales bacterium]|nr:ABC transporter ATP-binding protein [Burkholderiales bacterium]